MLAANAMSASAMWAANAATVSPAPDTADGRCHLTVANLRTMPHRSHEWPATLAQLRLAFADAGHFAVHAPGAAGVRRRGRGQPHAAGAGARRAGRRGVRLRRDAAAPSRRASISRRRRRSPGSTGSIPSGPCSSSSRKRRSPPGAFHNDVVAVANEPVLFAHEQAFADRDRLSPTARSCVAGFELVEVADAEVPLADAITSYLFNAQLVTPPDGEMTLIVPAEARETPSVWAWLERHLAGNGPIRRVEVVDVRQSMANGGGPACLRLRVVADPATVDPRFLVDEAKLDRDRRGDRAALAERDRRRRPAAAVAGRATSRRARAACSRRSDLPNWLSG